MRHPQRLFIPSEPGPSNPSLRPTSMRPIERNSKDIIWGTNASASRLMALTRDLPCYLPVDRQTGSNLCLKLELTDHGATGVHACAASSSGQAKLRSLRALPFSVSTVKALPGSNYLETCHANLVIRALFWELGEVGLNPSGHRGPWTQVFNFLGKCQVPRAFCHYDCLTPS